MSAPFAPFRTACPRSWPWPGSPPPWPPTGSCARSICRPTTRRFAVPADEPASAFVQVPEVLWRDVLCIQEAAPRRQRQLRRLARPTAADPADAAAAPPGARHRPGPRLSRRHGGHLQRAAAPGQLPTGGARGRRGSGRVTAATRPALWICGQRSAFPTTPQGQHNSGHIMRYLLRTR